MNLILRLQTELETLELRLPSALAEKMDFGARFEHLEFSCR